MADETGGQKSWGIDAKMMEMLNERVTKKSTNASVSMRLFGAPHQFLDTADYVLNNHLDMGRKYLQEISAEAPIVTFVPGKPNYLPDYSKDEKKTLMSYFQGVELEDKNAKSALDELMKDGDEEGRYFDFIADYSEYIKYVNMLCRVCSIYLGIGDKNVPGTSSKFKSYDWGDYKYNNNYKASEKNNKSIFDMDGPKETFEQMVYGTYRYVNFYVDPSTSFSESASNETTKSKLEGMFEASEGIVKELSFFMETMELNKTKQYMESAFSKFNDAANNYAGDGFFKSLFGRAEKVVKGANLIFPEIWGDSANNKSYNITMNLVSPYGDKVSIMMNIIVPLMHILALSLPRQVSANTYGRPFLVKVFSKGWFSCEMGIIDSISIDKGEDDSWTVDGLPTRVKVNLSVKDLYSNLMITPSNKPSLFFSNQGLIEFLGATCGLDLTKPTVITRLETMMAIFLNKPVDSVSNFYRDFMDDVNNKVNRIFR